MTIKIEIKGLEELKARLKTYSEEQIKAADEAVTQATFFVEGEVKESIAGHRDLPVTVDSSNYINSVTGEKTGLLQGTVSNNVEYAGAIEEYGWPPSLPPRPHFGNTAIRTADKVREFIEKKIKEVKL